MHVLQSIQWPGAPAFGVSELLYLRAEPRPAWTLASAGGIKGGPVAGGGQIRLDLSTFFGAFSLSTWCGPAALDGVVLEIECTGRATLEVYEDNGHEGPQLILSRRISGDGRKQYVDIPGLRGHRGILYPAFILTGGDELEIAGVAYCTRTPPRHEPRLAIVMPTYKRERAVTQNVARISAGLLADHPECKLFVIDNGSSVDLPALPGVELIRNRNYGGSGGFARGILEVKRAAAGFTNVLFCDDDVLVYPESIVRLLALLRYTDDVVVCGGMLQMGQRHILDQKSCYVVGIRLTRNHGFNDLRKVTSVARYDEPGFASFCGWWFACYPLGKEDRFLPMPYFLYWDDIEMGRRCTRLGVEMVSLLGIGIWHEEFEKKHRAWQGFYHARNGIATAMVYEKGALAAKQLFGDIVRMLETYRYDFAEFMLDGMDAAMRGPAALRATRADELHKALLSRPQVPFTDMRPYVIPERLPAKKDPPMRKIRWRSFFSRITLNGHLLPVWYFKSAREPSFPGWKVEDLHSFARWRIFRSRKVVYYEPTTGQGILCTVDHWRFFKLLARLCARWLVLRLRWRSLRDEWRREHDHLSSPGFWREYLGLAAAAQATAAASTHVPDIDAVPVAEK
jgi:galactofuranosylgalactofuranosylrhamnosyl-N-acetylglucosaminyl-diphospho-decaprenol beta-1,5/1,6-galactofuranosyltransferase